MTFLYVLAALVIGCAAGFIAGFLVFRKHAPEIQAAEQELKAVQTAVETVVDTAKGKKKKTPTA